MPMATETLRSPGFSSLASRMMFIKNFQKPITFGRRRSAVSRGRQQPRQRDHALFQVGTCQRENLSKRQCIDDVESPRGETAQGKQMCATADFLPEIVGQIGRASCREG